MESYPGAAILSDDLAAWSERAECPVCRRPGALFRILGRAGPAESERAAALAVTRIEESLDATIAAQADPALTNARRGFFLVYINSFNEWHEGHAFEPMTDAASLTPEQREVMLGTAEVRQLFKVPRVGTVAGCMVTHGTLDRKGRIRVIRDAVQVYEGELGSLKRFKDDVREVREGFECGIGLSDFQDLKQGDLIETYEEREIARV